MLDGGGDPNGRDEKGVPIIFSNWDVGAYTDRESQARFALLLERGVDVNATMPETGRCCHGYSLLLFRMSKGLRDGGEQAYADALQLLERGPIHTALRRPARPSRRCSSSIGIISQGRRRHRRDNSRCSRKPGPTLLQAQRTTHWTTSLPGP